MKNSNKNIYSVVRIVFLLGVLAISAGCSNRSEYQIPADVFDQLEEAVFLYSTFGTEKHGFMDPVNIELGSITEGPVDLENFDIQSATGSTVYREDLLFDYGFSEAFCLIYTLDGGLSSEPIEKSLEVYYVLIHAITREDSTDSWVWGEYYQNSDHYRGIYLEPLSDPERGYRYAFTYTGCHNAFN